MCGIAGFTYPSNIALDAEKALDLMLNEIAHRGLDNRGVYCTVDSTDIPKHIGLGHNRLSIIDTSARSSQPMYFEHLVIVFNGEIYNYKELQLELIYLGYSFNTGSDTEVILKGYYHFGVDFFKRLNGMFAFCIYNKSNNEILLVRDRLGVKPLYYYLDRGANIFLFASELKCFHVIGGDFFSGSINRKAINSFFKFGYVNSYESIFSSVSKVKAGHFISYKLETGEFRQNEYWSLNSLNVVKTRASINNIEDAYEEIRELLISSVKYRFVADVPVGLFLSSGIDSNLVLNIALKLGITDINTYTYKDSNPTKSENSYLYDNRVHQNDVLLSYQKVWDTFKFINTKFDEPFSDPATIGLYSLSKEASKFNKVILVGDGGDELFAGYQGYDILYFKTRNSIVNSIRKGFFYPIGKFLEIVLTHIKWMNKTDRLHFLNSIFLGENLLDVASRLDNQLQRVAYRLCGDEGFNENAKLSSNDVHDFLNYKTNSELVHQLNYKTDIGGMLNTIEIREPFLDYRLFEFQQRLSESLFFDKKHQISNKYFMRRLLNEIDPRFHEVKKSGFIIDVKSMINRFQFEIESDILTDSELIDIDYVRYLWKNYKKGYTNFTIIFRIISFLLWEHSTKRK